MQYSNQILTPNTTENAVKQITKKRRTCSSEKLTNKLKRSHKATTELNVRAYSHVIPLKASASSKAPNTYPVVEQTDVVEFGNVISHANDVFFGTYNHIDTHPSNSSSLLSSNPFHDLNKRQSNSFQYSRNTSLSNNTLQAPSQDAQWQNDNWIAHSRSNSSNSLSSTPDKFSRKSSNIFSIESIIGTSCHNAQPTIVNPNFSTSSTAMHAYTPLISPAMPQSTIIHPNSSTSMTVTGAFTPSTSLTLPQSTIAHQKSSNLLTVMRASTPSISTAISPMPSPMPLPPSASTSNPTANLEEPVLADLTNISIIDDIDVSQQDQHNNEEEDKSDKERDPFEVLMMRSLP